MLRNMPPATETIETAATTWPSSSNLLIPNEMTDDGIPAFRCTCTMGGVSAFSESNANGMSSPGNPFLIRSSRFQLFQFEQFQVVHFVGVGHHPKNNCCFMICRALHQIAVDRHSSCDRILHDDYEVTFPVLGEVGQNSNSFVLHPTNQELRTLVAQDNERFTFCGDGRLGQLDRLVEATGNKKHHADSCTSNHIGVVVTEVFT